jgi:hypothetical protein
MFFISTKSGKISSYTNNGDLNEKKIGLLNSYDISYFNWLSMWGNCLWTI